jgi:hypothetical protein
MFAYSFGKINMLVFSRSFHNKDYPKIVSRETILNLSAQASN